MTDAGDYWDRSRPDTRADSPGDRHRLVSLLFAGGNRFRETVLNGNYSPYIFSVLRRRSDSPCDLPAARLEIQPPFRRLIDAIMMPAPPVQPRVYHLARLALNLAFGSEAGPPVARIHPLYCLLPMIS